LDFESIDYRNRLSYDLIKRAEAYARALGLASETQRYVIWGAQQGHSLRFSSASAPDRCFHTGYRKGGDASQLDLLMDTAGVTLSNGITRVFYRPHHCCPVNALSPTLLCPSRVLPVGGLTGQQ
jgi:hypothetical protein